MMSASEPTATFNSNRDAQSKATPWVSSGCYTAAVIARLREIAPYAALELILPGGSLGAFLLWLYRRQKKSSFFRPRYKTAVAFGVLQSRIRMPARVYGTARQHIEEA